MRSFWREEMKLFSTSFATEMRSFGRKSAASMEVERSSATTTSMPCTDRSMRRLVRRRGPDRPTAVSASAALGHLHHCPRAVHQRGGAVDGALALFGPGLGLRELDQVLPGKLARKLREVEAEEPPAMQLGEQLPGGEIERVEPEPLSEI